MVEYEDQSEKSSNNSPSDIHVCDITLNTLHVLPVWTTRLWLTPSVVISFLLKFSLENHWVSSSITLYTNICTPSSPIAAALSEETRFVWKSQHCTGRDSPTHYIIDNLTDHNYLTLAGLVVWDWNCYGRLPSSKIMLSSFTSLMVLEISRNDFPPEAVELTVISGLHHNTTLEWLNINPSHFSPENINSLASMAMHNAQHACMS